MTSAETLEIPRRTAIPGRCHLGCVLRHTLVNRSAPEVVERVTTLDPGFIPADKD